MGGTAGGALRGFSETIDEPLCVNMSSDWVIEFPHGAGTHRTWDGGRGCGRGGKGVALKAEVLRPVASTGTLKKAPRSCGVQQLRAPLLEAVHRPRIGGKCAECREGDSASPRLGRTPSLRGKMGTFGTLDFYLLFVGRTGRTSLLVVLSCPVPDAKM